MRHLPAPPISSLRLAAGQCLLLDPGLNAGPQGLEVLEGIARVHCPCESSDGMTLAFLQPGDQLRCDRLCSEGVCLEAITPLQLVRHPLLPEATGVDAVNEWTLQLLRIRHLGSAEQRLQALLALLVQRLGRRCGNWCDLPFRLTHERIGELIGTTRVTTTRLMSRIRQAQLLDVSRDHQGLRLAPTLVEAYPLLVA